MNYSALARSYRTLSYPHQLKDLLSAFYLTDRYNSLCKYELAKVINDAVFKHYDGEQVLKYRLAKEFRNKDYVAAFEVRAKHSRTDFLVINGDTKSFEVKSKIDTLKRLNKQVCDYSDVFEYNSVVIDKVHLGNVLQIVPEYYGIWYFEGNKKVVYRKATYSQNIDSAEQLGLFNKKELLRSFGSANKNEILTANNFAKINEELKSTLKKRYIERWTFIQNNWNQILPIDLQFFFNTNVEPEIIYGH